MEEIYNDTPASKEENKTPDCGCTDGSCEPKKKNIFSKILFVVILIAAAAIIGIKLAGHSDNASGKQLIASPGKVSSCDSIKSKTCDTTKESSCCSKK